MILLPIIALYLSLSLVTQWLFLLLVLLLQILIGVLFSSYFSSISAKKELSNSLTNFSDINDQINSLIINKDYEEEKYERLKKLYSTAKLFDLVIDSIIFVKSCPARPTKGRP